MKHWLRRIRGAVGMGLTWAAGWALAGVLIGVTSILLPGLPWDSCVFRTKPITDFGPSRSPVSDEADHWFRSKPITPFG